MRFRRRRIRTGDDGTLTLRLSDAEQSLLATVGAELVAELDDPDDPSLRRLFPPGYSDDAVRDAGYQVQMGDELRQGHIAAARCLIETAHAERLDAEQAAAWLRSVNAVRLVLGTRLGITDDTEPVRIGPDDPDLGAWVAYDFLSGLLDELITTLSM